MNKEKFRLFLQTNIEFIKLTGILSGFALIALLIFLKATAIWGIGMRTDSVVYLTSAQNIASGIGFVTVDGFGTPLAISHWPPLYPFILAVLIKINFSPLQSARIIGGLLTVITVFVFGILIYKTSKGSIWITIFGIILLLCNPLIWDTYFYAMSEPLFIVLSLACYFYIFSYFENNKDGFLYLSALLAGFALLTRYVGIYLFIVLFVAILLILKESLKTKVVLFIKVSILSLSPLLLWSIRNYTDTGTLNNRDFAFAPILKNEWGHLADNIINDWFNPITKIINLIPLWLYIVPVTIGIFMILKNARLAKNDPALKTHWLAIVIMHLITYSAILIFARLFLDPQIPIYEPRMFFPIYLGFIFVSLTLISPEFYVFLSNKTGRPTATIIEILIIITLVVLSSINIIKTNSYINKTHDNGLSLNNAGFKNRKIFQAVQSYKSENPLYFSDNLEKFYWGTGINVSSVNVLTAEKTNQLSGYDIFIVILDNPEKAAKILTTYQTAEKIYNQGDGVIIKIPAKP